MAEKNNKINLRTLVLAIIFIGGIISAFVFFDGQIDGRIESHPKVVGLEIKQDHINEELKKINKKLEILEAIDWKLRKLLAEEYGP